MSRKRTTSRWFIISFLILVFVILIDSPLIHAQYWASIPPYNLLWPLWSPALSPPDPITGLPIPLVTELEYDTILPAQPGLAWNIALDHPWAMYNIPLAFGGGLAFFDITYGFNTFPPPSFLDPVTGLPAPITLPLGWSLYLPTKLKGFEFFIPLANAVYSTRYGVPISSLLTSADIWGLPPL